MIHLSKRLQMVADLVPSCDLLADIGTDHAYLPVWLVQAGRIQRAFAADLREGPLHRARETVLENDLADRIKPVLADGLLFPNAELADVISICGMGGETILSILKAAPWSVDRQLILQPQSKVPELEQWLSANSCGIQQAKLCMDAGKLYLAIFVSGSIGWQGSAESLLLQAHDPLLSEYICRETKKARKTMHGLETSSKKDIEQIRKIRQRLDALSSISKEIEAW